MPEESTTEAITLPDGVGYLAVGEDGTRVATVTPEAAVAGAETLGSIPLPPPTDPGPPVPYRPDRGLEQQLNASLMAQGVHPSDLSPT